MYNLRTYFNFKVMEQLVTLQKVLEASGKSKEEIAKIMAKATGEGLSESEISQVRLIPWLKLH